MCRAVFSGAPLSLRASLRQIGRCCSSHPNPALCPQRLAPTGAVTGLLSVVLKTWASASGDLLRGVSVSLRAHPRQKGGNPFSCSPGAYASAHVARLCDCASFALAKSGLKRAAPRPSAKRRNTGCAWHSSENQHQQLHYQCRDLRSNRKSEPSQLRHASPASQVPRPHPGKSLILRHLARVIRSMLEKRQHRK